MAVVNEHYLKLANNYLFADIAKKVNAYKTAHTKQQSKNGVISFTVQLKEDNHRR